MQTRRNFVLSGLRNFVAFSAGGSLLVLGREEARKATRNYNQTGTPFPKADANRQNVQTPEQSQDLILIPKQVTDKAGLQPVSVDEATDFVVGGLLGTAALNLTLGTIRRNQLTSQLNTADGRLQILDDTLSPLKELLLSFVTKNAIPHSCESPDDAIVIDSLVHTIINHFETTSRAAEPFIQELKLLRTALTQPLVEGLAGAKGDISAESKQALVQALKSDRLRAYLEEGLVNELKRGGGERICRGAVGSLDGEDLVSDDAINSLKGTLANALGRTTVVGFIEEGIDTAVANNNLEERYLEALAEKLADSEAIKDDDPALKTLRERLDDALEDDDVFKKLTEEVQNLMRTSDFLDKCLEALVAKLANGGIKDDDDLLNTLREKLNETLEDQDVVEKLAEEMKTAIENSNFAGDILDVLASKLTASTTSLPASSSTSS